MNDKLKKELQDKCWYWLSYADGLKEKDKWKYAETMAKDLDEIIQQEVPKGVCKHCWNKGYSTEMTEVVSSADFFGDKEYKTGAKITINFCKCDKGKQLKELIQREREEELDRIGLEKIYSESEKDRDLVVGYNQAIEDLEKIKSNLLKGRNKQKD